MKRIALAVFVPTLLWIGALTQRGLPLGLDEIEFFRATRWIALGLVPYSDFWEHHAPLQWIVFAPVARLASGPGVSAVVLLRWAQIPLWIATLWMIVALARRASVRACGWGIALLLLLLSPTFVQRAIEYRVDVLGTFAFVAAFTLVALRPTAGRWIAFGALLSLSVLANMRLAPLVFVAALLALVWRPDEDRWGFNAPALRMIEGVLAVAVAFFAWLLATESVAGFVDGVIEYNRLSSHVLAVSTFTSAILTPLLTLDFAGALFWIAGGCGIAIAVREFRAAGPLQIAGTLAVAGIGAIAMMQVHYDYHFQAVWVLLLPLAGLAIERLLRPWGRVVLVAAGTVTLFMQVAQTLPTFGAPMRYQDAVMKAADHLTNAHESVFDGVGYALRRKPAWRYWFLTTGVRFLAAEGRIPPYDAGQMAADPPAAIIADYRFVLYLQLFPRLQSYAVHHYLPVYRNLWVPGMAAVIGPVPRRYIWTSPRAGRYDIRVSDLLALHPWFTRPLEYVTTIGARAPMLEIPLARLPRYDAASLAWSVDGQAIPPGVTSLELHKGSRIEMRGTAPAAAGILLVPHGIETLCMAPEEEVVF